MSQRSFVFTENSSSASRKSHTAIANLNMQKWHMYRQSASKHGLRTFPYSAMRQLVCNGQLWARAALRQLCSYAGINFIHNHPPLRIPRIFTKTLPSAWGFASKVLPGGGLLGQLPRGGLLSINDVCHF